MFIGKKRISLLFICLISLSSSCFGEKTKASCEQIFLFIKDKGFYVSYDKGDSWNSENDNLKENINPIKLYGSNKYVFMTTYKNGLWRFEKDKRIWKNISSNDFKRRSIYSGSNEYRKISGFNIEKGNESSLVLATKHDIYSSDDSGESWKKIPMNGLHKRNYITAVAIEDRKIYAGTSFNGIYELKNGKFIYSGKKLPGEPYSGTLKFTEQISDICIKSDTVYAGFSFGKGIYYKNKKNSYYEKFNSFIIKDSIDDINTINNDIYYSSGEKVFKNNAEDKSQNTLLRKIISDKNPDLILLSLNNSKIPDICIIHKQTIKNNSNKAALKNAIYVSIPALRKNLNKYINLASKTEINSFVIDMKDDFGNLFYKSEIKEVKEIGSQARPIDIRSVIEKLKKHNIYSIARIVVFKDKKLFKAYGGKYTIKNKKNSLPWKGTDHEFWVDPYSTFVHDYNINIAKELERIGFNEIQFDYIRFPSDGPIHLCDFSFAKNKDTYKSEILIDFLEKAKQNLKIPLSVDIYGFNSWYNFGNWIGQDIDELSVVVDAICPMVYPSHFGNSFYKNGDRSMRSYRIVYDGAKRARELMRKNTVLRPYLQAFNLFSPTWGPGYIWNQIKASRSSGCSGYTLWNARGDYNTPEKALSVNR